MAFEGGLGAAGGHPAPQAATIYLREDLLDAVINLDKEKDAAVFLAAPKTTSNGLVHEWLIDALPATSTAGALEGDQWASGAVSGRTRLNNAVQHFRRDFAVTMDAVEYAMKGRAPGVSNEYEHQVENFLLANEQSMDARMVALGTAVISASAAAVTDTARTGAFRNWQLSATADPSAGAQGTGAATNAISMNISGAWSRTRFLTLHEAMFKLGAKPNTLAVDPGVKADITNDVLGEAAQATYQPANTSAIAATPAVVRQVHTDSSATEYTADIQFMRTDFGRIAILVDRFIPTAATSVSARVGGAYFLYDRSKARLAFWRPLRHYPLAPNGDSMRGYIHAAASVELLHPNTMGVGYNITT